MKLEKKTIAKIVAIAISFVFAFVAIFFAIRPINDYAGKGRGENVVINKPSQLAALFEGLPTASYYLGLSETDNQNSAKEATSRANFTTATVEQTSRTVSELRSEVASMIDKNENYLTRYLTAYYAEDGVYFNLRANVTNYLYSGLTSKSYSEQSKSTLADIDAYIGIKGVFVRYNTYDLFVEKKTVLSGEEVEEKESSDKQLKEAVYNLIRSNYGKWINLKYIENVNENAGDEELLISESCATISKILIEELVELKDSQIQNLLSIGSFSRYLERDEDSEYLYFASSSDKNSNITTKTNRMSANFFIKDKPIVSYVNYIKSSGVSIDSSENITISNIGNTVIKKIPSANSFDKFFKKTISAVVRATKPVEEVRG